MTSDLKITVGNLVDDLRILHGVKVDPHKVYRVKRKVLESASSGHHLESFRKLWNYAHVIKHQMLRALALFQVTKEDALENNCRFERLMVSFPTLRDGFKEGFRPFIGMNDCHLKGPFEGILLSVVALNANQGIFPIAICVCESENVQSWTWTLGHLQEYLADIRQFTFMIDRQKGVLVALNLEFSGSQNRFCTRHVFANMKASFPKVELRNQYWRAVRASDKDTFTVALKDIQDIDMMHLAG